MEKLMKWGAALVLLVLVGCATSYETETMKTYVTRASLEDISDEDLTVHHVNLDLARKRKKMEIYALVSFVDSAMEFAKIPNLENLKKDAVRRVETRLHQANAYTVHMLDGTKYNSAKLMSGGDIEGSPKPFFLDIQLTFGSEAEERYDHAEVMYKCSVDWKVIDNRLKSNGLGELDSPSIMEARTCKNVDVRKRITSLRNSYAGGTAAGTAQNVYLNVLENALIEMQCQIYNLFPFSAKITGVRIKDDQVRFSVRGGPKVGMVEDMQMMVVNSDGDFVGIGEVKGGVGEDSSLTMWRWLSKSSKMELTALAEKGKAAVEEYLDEEGNDYYVVCMGMPPMKHSRDQIRDFKR